MFAVNNNEKAKSVRSSRNVSLVNRKYPSDRSMEHPTNVELA